MKSHIVLCLFLSSFLGAQGPEEYSLHAIDAPPLIDLKTAFRLAKENNFTLKQKYNDQLIAESNVVHSFSPLLPHLGIKAEHQKNLLINSDEDGSKASLFMNASLFDLKSIFSLRSARDKLKAAQLAYKHEHNELLYKVAGSYLDALMAQSALLIAREEVEHYKKQLEVLEKKLKIGSVRPLDISRGEYLLKKAESELVSKERELAKKTARLGIFLNRKDNFLLADFELSSAYFNEDTSTLFELAQQSADIAALKKEYSSEHFNVISSYDFFPKLSARIEGGWRSFDFRTNNKDAEPFAQIFFNLELPLFSGGSSLAAIKKAYATRSNIELSLAELKLKKELSVTGALEQIAAYTLSIESADQALIAAQKAKESSDRLFNAGEATALEVAQANVELVSAKSLSMNAKLKLNQSKINLLFLVGKMDELQ